MEFWFSVSTKLHNHSVTFHLGRLLMCINVKVWKMPWKWNFFESQYCFANISAREALIFMECYVVAAAHANYLSLVTKLVARTDEFVPDLPRLFIYQNLILFQCISSINVIICFYKTKWDLSIYVSTLNMNNNTSF